MTRLAFPLARMWDPGTDPRAMVEWVTGHVMRYHLGCDEDIRKTGTRWNPRAPRRWPQERQSHHSGHWCLGAAVGPKTLVSLGFNVTGWSPQPQRDFSVTCLHGGTTG